MHQKEKEEKEENGENGEKGERKKKKRKKKWYGLREAMMEKEPPFSAWQSGTCIASSPLACPMYRYRYNYEYGHRYR